MKVKDGDLVLSALGTLKLIFGEAAYQMYISDNNKTSKLFKKGTYGATSGEVVGNINDLADILLKKRSEQSEVTTIKSSAVIQYVYKIRYKSTGNYWSGELWKDPSKETRVYMSYASACKATKGDKLGGVAPSNLEIVKCKVEIA